MNLQEKNIKRTSEKDSMEITVSHITIRQSISVLLGKIILIEILSGVLVVLGYAIFVSPNLASVVGSGLNIGYLLFFVGLVCLKIGLMIAVTVQWLEEYYEITPKELVHRSGFIFKKEESFSLEHLGTLEYDQSVLGRIFNYGTVRCFNWSTEKEVSLYLIHNPRKYHRILKGLLPQADQGKKVLREHILEAEEV